MTKNTRLPDRIGIDANGFGWRAWDDEDYLSMVPNNPDNEPVPQPVTWYVPVVESLGGDEDDVDDGAEQ